MRLDEFRPWHLAAMDPLGLRPVVRGTATLEYGQLVDGMGPAYTLFDGERVVACGGISMGLSLGNWIWSYIDEGAGRHMIALHRVASRLIAENPIRLRAATEVGFSPGCRWLEMLGFERRGPLSDLIPGQRGSWLYERG